MQVKNIEDLIDFSYLYVSDYSKKLEYFLENYDNLIDKKKISEFFGEKTAEYFFNTLIENGKYRKKILESLNEGSLKIVIYGDRLYPKSLKRLPDAPVLLYIRGNEKLLNYEGLKIGTVGSRKTDFYGEKITEDIVKTLSLNKVCIVSGMAYGIDSIAHKTALKNDGATISVLAYDGGYPSSNFKLYEEIINKGAVISEFPYKFYVNPSMFLSRNRIIAGLSDGILVTRAAYKSGSLNTASWALEYGKEVFAVPGNVYEKLSAGVNKLLLSGANLVINGENILDFYGLECKNFKENKEKLTEEEKILLSFIGFSPVDTDSVIIKSGLKSEIVFSLISSLEIKGYVKKIGSYKIIRI